MKNEKFVLFFLGIIFFLAFFKTTVFAEGNYVLPYPSNMPGSLSYRIHLIYENISKYWYFGDFGQFDYDLKMADKYLVEAKTLFEYKQYLLGYNALKKSDQYFMEVLPNLIRAEKNGKNINQKRAILKEAALKHIEVLKKMEAESPNIFEWQPEKSPPTTLNIKGSIENSINVRKNDL
jgi:hypothetical protein